MVPTAIIAHAAQKETAKAAILKRLKEAGATSAAMPASLEIDSDDKQAALADLLASGKLREARKGLFFLDETKAAEATPGSGLVAVVIILVLLSFAASAIALASLKV